MDKKIYELLLHMQKENSELKQAMAEGFARLEERIEKLEQTIAAFDETIESKINIQKKEDNIMNTVRYLSHKVAEHDEEIFHLKNKK